MSTERNWEPAMSTKYWKVGQLAAATGVTVRTLHHYDEIGLLSPSHHTGSGHRLYGQSEIVRLQQIKSLQALGFSLEQVRDLLGRGDLCPHKLLRMHMDQLQQQMHALQNLRHRLETIACRLEAAEAVSVEEFLVTIKECEQMDKIKQYYSEQQLEELQQRKEQVGEERIQQVQQEWVDLMARVREEMARGTDPTSDVGQQLAQQWMGLIREFTGGNPEIFKSLQKMYQDNPNTAAEVSGDERYRQDPEMAEFIRKGYEASQGS